MGIGKGEGAKARYWQRTLGEAAGSRTSIREFCRRRRRKESQFYWWQRRLHPRGAGKTLRSLVHFRKLWNSCWAIRSLFRKRR